jgi:hypothetical protein
MRGEFTTRFTTRFTTKFPGFFALGITGERDIISFHPDEEP